MLYLIYCFVIFNNCCNKSDNLCNKQCARRLGQSALFVEFNQVCLLFHDMLTRFCSSTLFTFPLTQWRTWRGMTAAQNGLILCLRNFSWSWRRRTKPNSLSSFETVSYMRVSHTSVPSRSALNMSHICGLFFRRSYQLMRLYNNGPLYLSQKSTLKIQTRQMTFRMR